MTERQSKWSSLKEGDHDSHSSSLDQSRGDADGELNSPSVFPSQGYSNAVRDELTTGDCKRLDGDQCATESRRSKLGNVEWSNASGSTYTETEYGSTDNDLRDRKRGADDDGTDDKP